MKLPELTEGNATRDFIDAFGGYNHNIRIGDNEFYDMTNLTSAYYPTLSPRKQRGTYRTASITINKPVGLIEKDALCYVMVSGTNLTFYMNGEDHDLGYTDIDADEERTMVSMGAYVIIMPDKKYINTKDTDDKGNIEATYESLFVKENDDGTKEYDAVTFTMCRADGTSYEVNHIGPNEPSIESTEEIDDETVTTTEPLPNGYTWLDTSTTPSSLKVYSSSNAMWSSVATTYVKISCSGIGNKFNAYDGVEISGISTDSLSDLNNTMVIYAKDESEESSDWIVVVGVMNEPEYIQKDQIVIKRRMPTMDFIVESNNRLWGCLYGVNDDGEIVNELYACKMGDFKNWNCFLGISTDSYYCSLGTDGQFTGAISYLGHPVFFKENCLHMVYGSYPAEFQVQDTACRGVQKGSEKSLAMVNETLYYKSRTGICAYSGSLPTEISSVLGEKSYSQAVGCSHKGKYYVSMKDNAEGKFHLFVCDTEKGLWYKEDELQVKSFCVIDDEIYFLDSSGNIKTIFGSGTPDTDPIKWMAETGVIGCSSPDKKYVSRITIRLKLSIGSIVRFSIQYDSDENWIPVCNLMGHNLRTNTLPIRPKRCDHFRLKIEGTGDAKIFSISKTMEQGSED